VAPASTSALCQAHCRVALSKEPPILVADELARDPSRLPPHFSRTSTAGTTIAAGRERAELKQAEANEAQSRQTILKTEDLS